MSNPADGLSNPDQQAPRPIPQSKIWRKVKVLRYYTLGECRIIYSYVNCLPRKSKQWLSKRFINIITYLDSRLTDYAFNPNANNYQDLSPSDSIDDKKLYSNMILWGIKNPNVTNIAITGPYGSGKSSIIRTFQKRNPKFRSVNISLASFDELKDSEGVWRSKVELSVLQQLIYHERSHALPDSRFVKIRPISFINRVMGTLFFSIFALSYFYVTQPDYFKRFKFLKDPLKEYVDFGSLGFLVLGSIYLLYRLYRTLRNLRFTKFSVVSAGAEFSEGESRSIFNKHLDEIIYFFEETRTELVIIEDLDRFNDSEIFTKLREINILINNSKQIRHKVNFIYAVRDNIFTKNDRTKFFDLLIPVIPIINVSNAGDALVSRLKGIIPEDKMPNDLLRTVTLYLQDMRMLLNIINEFSLYTRQLSDGLHPEKLLAIIIFKNLHPRDFAGLHNGKGMIIRVLEEKKKYVSDKKNELYDQINTLQSKVRELEALKVRDIEELRALYIYKAMAAVPPESNLIIKGKNRPSDFVKNELFEFWRTGNPANAHAYSETYRTYRPIAFSYEFSKAEKEVDPTLTYQDREDLINEYTQNGISRAKLNIDKITKTLSILSGQSLKEILDTGGKFTFPENNTSPVLIFLMSNGYIDEYYHPYISYFIEGSLTKEDMNFVMSVLNRQPLHHDYKLTNIDVIVRKWISIGQYNNTAVLNYDLLSWLLQQNDRETELTLVLGMISNNKEFHYVKDFIDRKKDLENFIPALIKIWPEFWEYLYNETLLSDDIKAPIAAELIKLLDINTLKTKVNATGDLASFLSFNPDIYKNDYLSDKQETLTTVLSELNVSIQDFHLLIKLESTLNSVYEKQLYTLNNKNLRYVMNSFGGQPSFPETAWKSANYTTILNSDAEHLKDKIERQLNLYLDLLIAEEENISESEESIIKILNFDELDQIKIQKFIKKQTTTISQLETVPERYYGFLLEERKIITNWKNISTYFNHTKILDEFLIEYLNDSAVINILKSSTYANELEIQQDGEILSLPELILNNDKLSFENYCDLIVLLHPKMEELDITKISEDKVQFLIENEYTTFTAEVFNYLQHHHPKLVTLLIYRNWNKFLTSYSNLSVSNETLIRMLTVELIFTTQHKLGLIQQVLSNQTMEENELGKIIIDFLANYPQWAETIEQSLVLPLLSMSFSHEERMLTLTPILSKISTSTFKSIEATLPDPWNFVTTRNTTQRSFQNFPRLIDYLVGIKQSIPDTISSIKEQSQTTTVFYKGNNN